MKPLVERSPRRMYHEVAEPKPIAFVIHRDLLLIVNILKSGSLSSTAFQGLGPMKISRRPRHQARRRPSVLISSSITVASPTNNIDTLTSSPRSPSVSRLEQYHRLSRPSPVSPHRLRHVAAYRLRQQAAGKDCLITNLSPPHPSLPPSTDPTTILLKLFGMPGRDQSPISVFNDPTSNSRSISRTLSSMRFHHESLFRGFIWNALRSCLDYDSSSFPMPRGVGVEELTFGLEPGLEDSSAASCEPYAWMLLSNA